jgi:hypothetical protein
MANGSNEASNYFDEVPGQGKVFNVDKYVKARDSGELDALVA